MKKLTDRMKPQKANDIIYPTKEVALDVLKIIIEVGGIAGALFFQFIPDASKMNYFAIYMLFILVSLALYAMIKTHNMTSKTPYKLNLMLMLVCLFPFALLFPTAYYLFPYPRLEYSTEIIVFIYLILFVLYIAPAFAIIHKKK